MTLPLEFNFPLHTEALDAQDPSAMREYMQEMVYRLQEMYTSIAQNVNGEQKRSSLEAPQQWTPVVAGATTAGTFTYFSRVGLVQRVGLMTDVFFDIRWTGVTVAPAGNLYIQLPYLVTNTTLMPFIGPIQSSTISYGTATVLTCNAIPNTYRLEIWKSQSGTTMSAIDSSTATAARLIGSIRYIGSQDG